MTTYALYTGWPEDAKKGPHRYRKSNLVMVGILVMSILASVVMTVLLRVVGNGSAKKVIGESGSEEFQDGAARREGRQRGLGGLWWRR